MKLFVDTANIKAIEDLMPLGIIDGITTNPSLLYESSAKRHQAWLGDV